MKMKNGWHPGLVAVLVLFWVTIETVCAGSQVSAVPASLDFGAVQRGDSIELEFSLINAGSDDQTIRFIDFSEPGMTALMTPVIVAGGSVSINLQWKTYALAGPVNGRVVFSFAGEESELVTVEITGHVIED